MTGPPNAPGDDLAEPTAQGQPPLRGLLRWATRTLDLRSGLGASRLPIGYFASVVDLGGGQGLAISTDGVGTKLLVAQLADRYDTIGIDCVAMNVNDVLCTGAEPLSMVDYLAVQAAQPRLLEEIGQGLYEGARQAGVTLVGGELATIPSVISGVRPEWGFDLAATCVGLVPLDRIIDGSRLQAGDALIALPSSGIHSNGLTLARRVLLDSGAYTVDSYVPELGRTLGEELLEPTAIYVGPVLQVLRAGIGVRALAHITGDGLLNLARVAAPRGYLIEHLPEPPAIFHVIRRLGGLSNAELYRELNMGVGFCLAVAPDEADAALRLLRAAYPAARIVGQAIDSPDREIQLVPARLTGRHGCFA